MAALPQATCPGEIQKATAVGKYGNSTETGVNGCLEGRGKTRDARPALW